ncbi:MAG: ABC transporter ATP-binding protein [Fibrobacteria bacterium]
MIEVAGINKTYGKVIGASYAGKRAPGAAPKAVLNAVDLAIADGEFFCLLGPSGCGKTTLLRIIAGLETADSGSVRVGGKDVTTSKPHERGCAMVFQNYALWPHLTVAENIAYGLEVQRRGKEEIRNRLESGLHAYQLSGLEGRYPHELSGGQQQRVALARAMAIGPRAVLMDEPLSNLDAALRKTLRRELLEFHRRAGSTILYVTHDQEEALALSDRIAVMMEGRIVELGKPADLYARPASLESAMFLGDMNVMCGEAVPDFLRKSAGQATTLCIRPENVVVQVAGSAGAEPAGGGSAAIEVDIAAPRDAMDANGGGLSGTLAFSEFLGTHATVGVDTASGRILARVTTARADAMRAGQSLRLDFPTEYLLWY